MARSGFSGGLCLIEWNFALGVITESLINNEQAPEQGYMAVISVEPIYVCLQYHKIMPKIQKEVWGDFWDEDLDISPGV